MISWLLRWTFWRPLALLVSVLWPAVPRRRPTVVRMRLAGRVLESLPRGLPFMPVQGVILAELTAMLRAVAREPGVVALRLELGRLETGLARIQEIRRALQAVRAAGKEVHVHLDGGGLRELLLACDADRITCTPMGSLDLVGIRSEVTYLGGLAATLGVHADFEAVGDYKSFAERFVRTAPTTAARSNSEALFADLWDQLVRAVAAGRGLDRERAAELLGNGPHGAEGAVRLGLIDATCYADDVGKALEKRLGKKLRFVPASRFWSRSQRIRRLRHRAHPQPMAAVITAAGQIVPAGTGVGGSDVIAARTVSRQLGRVRKDDQIAAVVLRIDSPGGSAEASDLLWREVRRLAGKKPVVASMGETAASGGYYMAMGADRILAQPGTLTGSIGVVAGKVNIGGLYERLGLQRTVIAHGDHTGMYSLTEDFSAAERARLRERMQEFYEVFVAKAAEGRHMDPAELERHARGRVWTGRQARRLGLVDGLGGLSDAVALASELAGHDEPLPVAVVRPLTMPLWFPGRWADHLRSSLAARIPALTPLLHPEFRTGGLMAWLPVRFRIF